MFLFPAIALVTSLAAFASPFTGKAKRANGQFQQSLMTMSSDLGEVQDSLSSLPASGGSFSDLMPVGLNFVTLAGSTSQATADAKNFSENDPTDPEIVSTIQKMGDAVRSIVTSTMEKKDALDSQVVGCTQYITANMQAFYQNFMEAVTNGLPPDSPLQVMKSSNSAWFDKTL